MNVLTKNNFLPVTEYKIQQKEKGYNIMAKKANGQQVDQVQYEAEMEQQHNEQLATPEDLESMSAELAAQAEFGVNEPGNFDRPAVLILSTFTFENGTTSETISNVNDFQAGNKMWNGIKKNLRGAVNNGPGAVVTLRLATKEDVRRVLQAQMTRRFRSFTTGKRRDWQSE